MAQWRKPARLALIWAGLGIIILVAGLALDRYYHPSPVLIWIMIALGIVGLIAGAIILLNVVAPRSRGE